MEGTTPQTQPIQPQHEVAYKFDRVLRELFKLADIILTKTFPVEYAMGKLENDSSYCLEKFKEVYNGSDLIKTANAYRSRFSKLFNSNRLHILEVLTKKPKECWLFQDTANVNIADGDRYQDFSIRLSMIYRYAIELSDKAFNAKLATSPDLRLHERFLMVIYEVFETCDIPAGDVQNVKAIIDYLAANLKIRPINAPTVADHPLAAMFGGGGGFSNVVMPILSAFGMDKVVNDMGGLDGIKEKITSPEAQASIGGMMEKLQNAGSIQNGIEIFMNDMQNNKGVADVIGNVLGPLRGMAANAAGEALKDTSNIPEPLVGVAKMLQGFGNGGSEAPGSQPGERDDGLPEAADGQGNSHNLIDLSGTTDSESSTGPSTGTTGTGAAQNPMSQFMSAIASSPIGSMFANGMAGMNNAAASGVAPGTVSGVTPGVTPGAAPSPMPGVTSEPPFGLPSGLPAGLADLPGLSSMNAPGGGFNPAALFGAAQTAMNDPNSPFASFAPMLSGLGSMFGQMNMGGQVPSTAGSSSNTDGSCSSGSSSTTTSTSSTSTSTSNGSSSGSSDSNATLDFPF